MNKLTERINQIYERFENDDFTDEIKNELRTINDYAKALDDGALLVAIVGDVKAGKSTFCNLLANKSICQTDSKECTARPMFITNGDNKYRTYTRTIGNATDKRIIFEQILSNIIRNSNDEIVGIEITSNPITEGSKKDSNENKTYFLTSFSVDSSDLVKNKIVFADLPGLNGSKFNFDEFQEILLSRADYIIFIQNSTTDTTDSDINVFNYIGDNNSNVMISVFMNLFDKGSYNIDDKSREEAEEKLSVILNKWWLKKFINLNSVMSVVVNLGILEARRQNNIKEDRKPDAEIEDALFREFKNKFTENVINKSDEIRKPNIEHNINSRVLKLAKKVDNSIKEHENKINEYNDFAEKASNVQDIIDQNLKTTDSRAWTIDISTIINSRKPQIKTKADYEDVKTKVEKFLKSLREDVVKAFQNKIQDVCKTVNSEIMMKVKAINKDFSDTLNLTADIRVTPFRLETDNEFTKEVSNTFTKPNEVLEEPNILRRWFRFLGTMTYSPEQFDDITELTMAVAVGELSNKSEQFETFEKDFNRYIQAEIAKYTEKLSSDIYNKISDKCEHKKTNIIGDYDGYCTEKMHLVDLKDALCYVAK